MYFSYLKISNLYTIDLIIISIAHNEYLNKKLSQYKNLMAKNCLIFDLKNKFNFLKPDITL